MARIRRSEIDEKLMTRTGACEGSIAWVGPIEPARRRAGACIDHADGEGDIAGVTRKGARDDIAMCATVGIISDLDAAHRACIGNDERQPRAVVRPLNTLDCALVLLRDDQAARAGLIHVAPPQPASRDERQLRPVG
jgi:hypothetical protein